MIILHTADWHLGKRLETHSRLPEQKRVMDEIVQHADHSGAEVILIAGDVFDQYLPGNEADELYFSTITRLSRHGRRPVVIIAGNHDSPDHLLAPEALAREMGIITLGYPRQEITPYQGNGWAVSRSAPGFVEIAIPDSPPLRIIATPYANAIRLRTALDPEQREEALQDLLTHHWDDLARDYFDADGCNLFMGHLYMASDPHHPEPEPDDEKPILYSGGIPALPVSALPAGVQYAALGHLHRTHRISGKHEPPVVYSGSPVSYSFAEAGQTKHVVIIDVQPNHPASYQYLPLTGGLPLIRHKSRDIDEATAFLADHQDAYIELTMVCAEYLSSEWKNRLESAHPRVLIIPEIDVLENGLTANAPSFQLDHLDDVFVAYFQHKTGIPPDQAMMDLFHELINEDDA